MGKLTVGMAGLMAASLMEFSAVHAQQGPRGFTLLGEEEEACTLTVNSVVAYGSDGQFSYLNNQIGIIALFEELFGDPFLGSEEDHGTLHGFSRPVDTNETTTVISAALKKIQDHLTGASTLTASQINTQTEAIREKIYLIGNNEAVIRQAFDIVNHYETNKGPFFINEKTEDGFPNNPGKTDGYELERAVFTIQQGLHQQAFNLVNLKRFPTLFQGKRFQTAAYFPGAVDAPADPTVTHTVKINGSLPTAWGRPTYFSTSPARRPTGCYLAPGSVGTVTVPASMVNKGFSVLVGAHTADQSGKPDVRRFFSVTKSFPIMAATTPIANPFGGGIYIVVPYQADAGVVNVQVKNAVRSPFFSATSFHKTTLAEWLSTERTNPGPWADFESDKFMLSVPRNWIYRFADPVTLMRNWDKSMDAVSDLLGYPLVRNCITLYEQVDVMGRFWGFYGAGYPQVNETYDPTRDEEGNADHWFLNLKSGVGHIEFHELGHEHQFTKFPGEEEAMVNLLSVAIWNRAFGMDIDSALGASMGVPWVSRDQAAMNWMVTPNFRKGREMDISGSTKDEVQYQPRGYMKYVEIATLFGWEALHDFYYQEQLDYIADNDNDHFDGVDSRILRLSRAAGADLRPLIHFWGVQPESSASLKDSILAAGLRPSRLIYDRLMHYKSIIPANSAQFKTHAHVFCNTDEITTGQSPDYGEGWYHVWLPLYGEKQGDSARRAMQEIIDRYFPGGRPEVETAVEEGTSTETMLSGGTALITPRLIDIRSKGAHSVRVFTLAGKLLWLNQGTGPAHYSLSRYGKGMYIVHVKTATQNIRQKQPVF